MYVRKKEKRNNAVGINDLSILLQLGAVHRHQTMVIYLLYVI